MALTFRTTPILSAHDLILMASNITTLLNTVRHEATSQDPVSRYEHTCTYKHTYTRTHKTLTHTHARYIRPLGLSLSKLVTVMEDNPQVGNLRSVGLHTAAPRPFQLQPPAPTPPSPPRTRVTNHRYIHTHTHRNTTQV
jgi:alpha-D-ribose 1-methylphosphonate 5-triphosphate diphosphatase PhnM